MMNPEHPNSPAGFGTPLPCLFKDVSQHETWAGFHSGQYPICENP